LKERASECLPTQRARRGIRGNLKRGWNRVRAASGKPESHDFLKLKAFLSDCKFEERDVLVMSGGFCNKVFKVNASSGNQIVKFYSSVSKLRTQPELRNLADVLCADLKLSPNVLKKSDCGIAHEFICGEVLTEEELHNASDELLHNIARKIHTLHTLEAPQPYGTTPLIWTWLECMLAHIDPNSIALLDFVSLEDLKGEILQMKNSIKANNLPVVFCHGDLKPSNLLFDSEQIWLIDLELAGPNYRGFDLMKLFRAKPELFSEESFKYFMSCYAENEPRTTVDELILECRTCEALTWLEAAIFFALMLSAQIGKPVSSTF